MKPCHYIQFLDSNGFYTTCVFFKSFHYITEIINHQFLIIGKHAHELEICLKSNKTQLMFKKYSNFNAIKNAEKINCIIFSESALKKKARLHF